MFTENSTPFGIAINRAGEVIGVEPEDVGAQ
jgi:hypothetical protein